VSSDMVFDFSSSIFIWLIGHGLFEIEIFRLVDDGFGFGFEDKTEILDFFRD